MADAVADRLAGAWILDSFRFTAADGGTYEPLGETPAGTVTFTPDRYITFSFMAADRIAFSANDLFGGTEAERAAAAMGYVSFGGPFEIDEDAIVIDIAYSLFPNWVGKSQTRRFSLDGDRLTLSTPGMAMFNGVERRGEARLRRARGVG